jgi:molybdate transport system substrate-binding protein
MTLSMLAGLTMLGSMGCGQPTSESATANADSETTTELTISVAASVQDAMKQIQSAYEAAAPEVVITFNFGSSGSLAQQVAQGAPTDVFLSASKKWMDDLEDQGLILAGSRQDLLQNSMVLIVPQDKTTVADFQDLGTDAVGKIAMGEPESVPAGRYAKEVLTSLTLFDELQPKLVFGKDVRQVLSYVETGNVDAGLVYATDASLSDRVQVIATAAADSHSPIVYPIAVVQDSDNAAAAQAFVEFLSSDTAVDIFEQYGFAMAEPQG